MLNNSITVSAPGKIIIMGEHAVVYGQPAVIGAINKRCFVSISPRKDKKIIISSNKENLETVEKDILNKTIQANNLWKDFQGNNNIIPLKNFFINPSWYIAVCVGQTLLSLKKSFNSGVNINIKIDISIGSGFGSSAAIATAVVGAVYAYFLKSLNKNKIAEIAFLCEGLIHGNPSGVDIAASIYGGFIEFKKKEKIKKISINFSSSLINNFFIIDTGKPSESTGEMINFVAMQKNKKIINSIFINQGIITKEIIDALKENNNEKIINFIKSGEENLEKLGVVSSFTKKIIRQIEKAQGVAKICGAGGIKKSSGVLLVFTKDKDKVKSICKKLNLILDNVKFSKKGVSLEV